MSQLRWDLEEDREDKFPNDDFLKNFFLEEKEEKIEAGVLTPVNTTIPAWFYGMKEEELKPKCTEEECIGPFHLITVKNGKFIKCTNCDTYTFLS